MMRDTNDILDLIRLRTPKGARLNYNKVNEPKDVRYIAYIGTSHPEIAHYMLYFACSSVSQDDALSKLLDRLPPL